MACASGEIGTELATPGLALANSVVRCPLRCVAIGCGIGPRSRLSPLLFWREEVTSLVGKVTPMAKKASNAPAPPPLTLADEQIAERAIALIKKEYFLPDKLKDV
jgi:hypothetical protein